MRTTFETVAGVWLAALLVGCGGAPRYPEPSPSFFEPVTLSVEIDGTEGEVGGARVERPFFESTGVAPQLGRLFGDAEYTADASNAAIVSARFWRDNLEADPTWIGRALTIDGTGHTVVGVMPPGFESPAGTALWIAGPPPAVVFQGVRLFDGETVVPVATVVIENRVVTQVSGPGEQIRTPLRAHVVDGTGKTLLPGMVDAHAHSINRERLKGAVAFGVTTHLDMFTALPVMQQMKAEQEAGAAADRADLFSAGTLVTAPGGHGTQYGFEIPVLSSSEEAGAFVDARVAEGADYIKLIHDDGRSAGMSIPTLDKATLRAAVEAAHARNRLAVVHIGDREHARSAVEVDADGLVHVFADQPTDDAFIQLAARRGVFVVPTLAIIDSVGGGTGGAALIDDPHLNPLLMPAAVANLNPTMPAREGLAFSLDIALEAVRRLHRAGVPVLAGTDAPNPGTYHGVSMHEELELLVRAGLTPVEALAAATSATADAFGLDDRGRIAPGARADVWLVDGDPTTDILATRAIEGIWKEGRRWKLELLREQVQRLRAEQAAAGGKRLAVDELHHRAPRGVRPPDSGVTADPPLRATVRR